MSVIDALLKALANSHETMKSTSVAAERPLNVVMC
jgi:hypothetical protein